VAENVRLTHVQFEKPFDYSTSTWNEHCAKNISKFRPMTMRQQSPLHSRKEQAVGVVIETISEPYRYTIKSMENPPYFRFTIPGKIAQNYITKLFN